MAMAKFSKPTLLIVESPAKCGKFESFLGSGYKCMASFGHITTLSDLKHVDVANNFKPTFKIIDSKRSQINKLRSAIAGAKEVILATDDDREGEAIAWHICQQFELPVASTKRIIFHEITKPAIVGAVASPTVIDMNKVHAQQARQVLDLLVGFKISPMLWSHITRHSAKGMSAGRCQTPALGLVYDNYKDIERSPGKMVYNTTGYFTSKNIQFQLNTAIESQPAIEEFLEASVNHSHVFSRNKERNTTKKPPAPFTTSALQQMANNELRSSPKETMSMCQKLYEGGYITYMRTDSEIYSEEFIGKAKNYITATHGADYVHPEIDGLAKAKEPKKGKGKGKAKGKAKGEGKAKAKATGKKDEEAQQGSTAQEAHEAIRPTKVELTEIPSTVDLPAKTKRMYKLIWRNTVESCMAVARYTSLTCRISAAAAAATDGAVDGDKREFRNTEEQVVFPGWKAVAGYTKENADYAFLKNIKNNTELDYNKIAAKVTLKNLKSHYTEAKLVQLLEEKGIGRPSTFSALIEKIQERGYVKRDNIKGKTIACVDYELEGEELTENETQREFGNEKNKLVIQSLGIVVFEFLQKYYNALFNYDFTREMESRLDVIAEGGAVWHRLCGDCHSQIETLSAALQTATGGGAGSNGNGKGNGNSKFSYKIDAQHTYMIGKFGPVVKYTEGDITKFKGVRKDLDVERLKEGGYTLEEILEPSQPSETLGTYKGEKLYIRKGKYGYYAQYGDTRVSLKGIEQTLEKEIAELTIEDIQAWEARPKSAVLRKINDVASVRQSKFGYYIFYKPPKFAKPKFISLTKFVNSDKQDPLTCDMGVLEAFLPKQ
jgi:DNA topoisomerase-1